MKTVILKSLFFVFVTAPAFAQGQFALKEEEDISEMIAGIEASLAAATEGSDSVMADIYQAQIDALQFELDQSETDQHPFGPEYIAICTVDFVNGEGKTLIHLTQFMERRRRFVCGQCFGL